MYESFVDCSINSCAEVTGSDDRILLFYSSLSNTRARTHTNMTSYFMGDGGRHLSHMGVWTKTKLDSNLGFLTHVPFLPSMFSPLVSLPSVVQSH